MWLSSGTSAISATMASSDPSHGTPNDVNALSHLDTAPSLEKSHGATEKLASASAEETLPSPPQQESLDARPNVTPASETRASSREPTMERTMHAKSGSGSPMTRSSPIHDVCAIAAEATGADGAEHLPRTESDHMQIDGVLDEQEPSSVQTSPNQAESYDSISSSIAVSEDATSFEARSDVAKEEESSQSPQEPIPQEPLQPDASPHIKGEAQEDAALDMCASVPEQPLPAEVVRDTLDSLARPEISQTRVSSGQRYTESSSSSDTSKLTHLSELSMRLSDGLGQATAPASCNGFLNPISEHPPSNDPETPSLAPSDSPSIPPAQFIPGSPLKSTPTRRTVHKVKPKASIPHDIHILDYAAQCVAAAEASRLNPYGLEVEEHALLRQHITHAQVTTYLNIRNGILRLWLRKPHIAITRNEAIGCARESRWFDLASLCFDWLVRRGYVNYGCVEIKEAHRVGRPRRSQANENTQTPQTQRKRIVIIGAGMSGLGCARQLHNLFKQFRDQFGELDEQVPEIVILEGRERVGGRVYSRAFEVQPKNPNPDFPQSRCTAEMGGMIVTGFDRGNPMNTLVRGQLGLGYHALLSTTTIYDVDGRPVDIVRDGMVENLFNECLDRVSEYKYKMPVTKTSQGNRDNIDGGRDSSSDGHRTIAYAEEAAAARAAASAAARSAPGTPLSQGPRMLQRPSGPETTSPRADLVPVSSDRVTGRARLEPGIHAALKAAHKVKAMGWDLKPGVEETRDLDLDPPTQTPGATFGYVVEEAIKQYSDLIDLNAQDYRLLNWHVANLEYSNAINHNHLSLLAWDLDAGNEWDGPHSMIVGGYQSVARGLMLCPSPLDVRYKMAVKKIIYACSDDKDANTDTADAAQTYRAPVVIECENGESVEADYVVNTMPLGVLKHGNVEFSPPLPPWKSDAIGRIGFGVLNKIILTYRQPFWDTERDIFGILRQPSNRFSLNQKEYSNCRGRMFQWFNVTKTTGIPCLIALMAGDAAFDQEKTSNDKLVAEATAVLRSVFGAHRVPNPIEAVVTRWVSDEFARGSYSSAGPEMKVDDYDIMARPVGRHLHFAGEHTIGTYPATVHGAYLSGVRAASDLVDELLGPFQFPTPLVLAKEGATTSHTASSLKRKLAIDYDERRTPGDESSSGSVSANGSGGNTTTNSNANGSTSANGTASSSGYRDAKATSRRRMEAREMRILEYVVGRIGSRPVRPAKTGDTSYLLFSRANYDLARQKCEEGRRPGKSRALPNEVRVLTSKMWRSASAEERQPYADQAAIMKKKHDESVQDFLKKAAEWDQQAKGLRADYERDHPEDGTNGAPESTLTIAAGTTQALSSATPSATPSGLGSPFTGGLNIDLNGVKDAMSIAGLDEEVEDKREPSQARDAIDTYMTS
ncbi:lysine-specific histone demethylase 1 [Ophiostoma piceae UAMH 11346]|uniref:Lysine-specific histone demethylase 1 n=1 Tax=Ophiostoma piceae (strain UAMH 11346) TaxID=1262450 RepID=S3D3C5_OPHP1|nr:lysine-specific histone demethylase 1 [Ophiostoma piceae UAMH 11346]